MTGPHAGSPFWVPSAALQAHLNRTATGRADCDWLSHVRAAHLPARVGRTLVLGCGNGFQRSDDSRPDGNDPAAPGSRLVHCVRGGLRDAIALGVGCLAGFETRDARVQHERSDRHAYGFEARHQRGRERAPG